MTVHIEKHQMLVCGGGFADQQWVSFKDSSLLGSVDCWKCISLHLGKGLPAMSPIPEHVKLKKAKKSNDVTQLLGEFIQWMSSQGIVLAEDKDETFWCDECGKVTREDVQYVSSSVGWECLKCGAEDIDYTSAGLYPYPRPMGLLSKFFNINEQKLEDEKWALLDHIRLTNEMRDWAESEGRKALGR